MNQEKIFANGIRFQDPGPKAPSFVKGKISVKVDEFIEFLQAHEKNGWVNLDLKESKKGTLYLELNTWQTQRYATRKVEPAEDSQEEHFGGEEVESEDIPF